MRQAEHRVVIVGAGFGGLFAAKALRSAPASVTLINGTTYHLFEPLLYQVAAGILSEGEVAPPIRGILRHRNLDVRLGWVTDVDVDAGGVELDGGERIEAHTKIWAAGVAAPPRRRDAA
jgi:NADH dehydrogenase